MKIRTRRAISMFMLVLLLLQSNSARAVKLQTTMTTSSLGAMMSLGDYELGLDYYDSVKDEYMFTTPANNIGRLIAQDKCIVVEEYNENLSLVSSIKLPRELTIWGGFYCGKKYNWLFFGQENLKERTDLEVIRAVKYSKHWKRISAASYYSPNDSHNSVYMPFESSSTSMAEYGDYLYVRTGKELFEGHAQTGNKTYGGHAQTECTLEVNQETMKITGGEMGRTSNSLDQFIDATDGVVTSVDLGDAIPRALVFYQCGKRCGNIFAANKDYGVMSIIWNIKAAGTDNLFRIGYTGVALGGYKVSATNYLVAFNSVDQSKAKNQDNPKAIRDVYIAHSNRKADKQDRKWIVNRISYTGSSGLNAGKPHLIQVQKDKYLLLWNIVNKENEICYAFVNGQGEVTSKIYSAKGELSICEPITWNNKAIWYSSNGDTGMVFYTIDSNGNLNKKLITNAKIGTKVTKKGICYRVTKQKIEKGKPVLEVEVSGAKKTIKNAWIQESVKIGGVNYNTKNIAKKAFQNHKKLKMLYVYANLKKIGVSAFDGCNKLESVSIGKVTSVGKNAFRKVSAKCSYWVLGKKYKKMLCRGGASKESKFF